MATRGILGILGGELNRFLGPSGPLYRDALLNYLPQRRGGVEERRGLSGAATALAQRAEILGNGRSGCF